MLEKFREKKMQEELTEDNGIGEGASVIPASVEKTLKYIVIVLSIAMCAFQIYTSATLPLQTLNQRAVHLAFALALVFLYEASKCKTRLMRVVNYVLAIAGVVINIYIIMNWRLVQQRAARLTTSDMVFGALLLVVVIIAGIRTVGIWMPAIAAFFLAYCWFGQYITGLFKVSRLSLHRAIGYLSLGSEGVYGTCLGAAATFAFMFVVFAECLLQLGAGDFMINLAQAALGTVRGGPAKIAVVASALFGTVSGSSVANVAGTGCLTIPMMKRMGFRAEFAGGVESAASTGGGIMPPVMGAAAFVMAELISVEYSKICIAAAVPAILYYLGVFVMVDLEAVRKGLRGIPKEEVPDARKTLKEGWHYLFCIGTLILLLIILEWSAAKSALWATVVLIVSDVARKLATRQKIQWKMAIDIAVKSCKSALTLSTATACAGIIVGAFSATGLNTRLSSILITLAGGRLALLLVLAMIGAIILGMGLPTTPVYILLAVLVAPALVQMGVPKIAAHLFVLYYGVMAPITPPVGLAFYVAAGIAESSPMKTGWEAVKLAIVGFIIPFIFVYNPALLLDGPILEIIQVVGTSTIGVVSLAFALQGYAFGNLGILKRLLFGVGAILSIIPELYSDIVGVAIFVVLVAMQLIKAKRTTGAAAA